MPTARKPGRPRKSKSLAEPVSYRMSAEDVAAQVALADALSAELGITISRADALRVAVAEALRKRGVTARKKTPK